MFVHKCKQYTKNVQQCTLLMLLVILITASQHCHRVASFFHQQKLTSRSKLREHWFSSSLKTIWGKKQRRVVVYRDCPNQLRCPHWVTYQRERNQKANIRVDKMILWCESRVSVSSTAQYVVVWATLEIWFMLSPCRSFSQEIDRATNHTISSFKKQKSNDIIRFNV